MLKYELFVESRALDLIQESIIYFTPEFREVLKSIELAIAQDLLGVEESDVEPDLTFIDIDKEGYLSFSSMKNVTNLITKSDLKDYDVERGIDKVADKELADELWIKDKYSGGSSTGVTKRARSSIKIGKLINRIFPEKYTDKEIEQFVNAFKSSVENPKEKFEIIDGDKIEYWYDVANYFDTTGTLGGSCMRARKGIFEIYTGNPEVCKLVILTESGKLKGRALLWKVTRKVPDKPFEWFLDRQYTNKDSDVDKFKRFAKKMGWAYKAYNSHSDQEVSYLGKQFYLQMSIILKAPSNDKFPYMDTFKRFNPETSTLYNDSEQYNGQYILEATDGSYYSGSNHWSDYYDEEIPEDDAVYSEPLGDYIWLNRAVRVNRGSNRYRGWYPEHYDEIVYSEYLGGYIHNRDAVYSDFLQSEILIDRALEIVTQITPEGDCNEKDYVCETAECLTPIETVVDKTWYKWCLKNHRNWFGKQVIDSDLLCGDLNNDLIPVSLKEEVYEILVPIGEVTYLTKLDSFILNRPINESQVYKIDRVEYDTILYKGDVMVDIIEGGQSKLEDLKSEDNTNNLDQIERNQKISEIENRIYQVENEEYVLKETNNG